MHRYTITFITFLTVLGLYFLYGWTIVPAVLPSNKSGTQQNTNVILQTDEPREEMIPYAGLFAKGSWERNPKVEMLRSGETLIFFLNQEIKGNKAVLKPCTILFLSEDEKISTEERIRQAVVMRTPEYAEIEFDGDLNFSKFPLPKMTGGKLYGKVVIQSDLEEPEADDDLHIETQNIAFSDSPQSTVISTVYDVVFRMGQNTGKGTELQLTLLQTDAKNPKSPKTLNSVQLKNLDYLNLCFDEKKEQNKKERKTETRLVSAPASVPQPETASAFKPLARDVGASSTAVAPSAAVVSTDAGYIPLTARNMFPQKEISLLTGSDSATLLNIKCRREFLLNAIPVNKGRNTKETNWLAEFRGQVVIERTDTSGLKESITGEIVQVRFAPKTSPQVVPQPASKEDVKTEKDNPLDGLEPVEFLALGQLAQGGLPNIPACLISPRNGGVVMKGDRILYDITKNIFTLETDIKPGSMPQVHINLQNRYDIYGEKGFQYTLPPDGSFGTLISGGKGSLKGIMGDVNKPQKIAASWNQIQIEPYQSDPSQVLIQLTGSVKLTVEGAGSMRADKIDLWCRRENQKNAGSNSKSTNNKSSNLVSGNPFENSGELIPDRGIAAGNVHFENESGTCDVKQFQCFFRSDGNQVSQSRGLPQQLTQQRRLPPPKPLPPQNPIQQVQYQAPQYQGQQSVPTKPLYVASAQPIAPQQNNLISPVVLPPITQDNPQVAAAQPSAANNATVQSRQNTPVNNNAANNGNKQNIIGLNSGDSRSKFAVTADRMIMDIHMADNKSPKRPTEPADETYVEKVWFGGGVHIIEKIADLPSTGLVDIRGSEIDIWNPSAPNTIIRITGTPPSQEAIFKGRGIQMNAMKVEIFRDENLICVDSPGRLFTTSVQQDKSPLNKTKTEIIPVSGMLVQMQPLSANSNAREEDNRLVIEWNETMRFNGQTMRFTGRQDRNGGRVQAHYQQQKMFCDLMEIHLNRIVQIFDDKSNNEAEAEMIDCAFNVSIENRQLDENRQLKSYDRGCFDAVRVYLKSDDFVARGPGFLRSTSLKSDNSFSDKINTSANNSGQLSFLCVWFQDYIRGNFYANHKRAEVTGRVQVIYCPVRGWDEIFDIDQISAAARLGYYMQCERLEIVEMPDIHADKNSAAAKTGSLELTAQGNTASIEGNSFYGKAEIIKYNQAKNLIIFDGKAWVRSGQRELPAQRIEYNIETGALNTSSVNGLSIRQ